MNGYTLEQIENNIKNKITTIFDGNNNLPIKKVINQLSVEYKHLEKSQIEKYVKNMIRDGLILIGSELTKKKVLDVIDRKRILYFLYKNPGKIIEEISMNLRLNLSKTIWHLTLLQKFNYIKMKKEKNKQKYYPFKGMEVLL